MTSRPTHAALKKKLRIICDGLPQVIQGRIYCSTSWIVRAAIDRNKNDLESRFLFLWIAFNAAYADEKKHKLPDYKERECFNVFFKRLVDIDIKKRIYNAIWQGFSGPIRTLINNHYDKKSIYKSIESQDTIKTLDIIFKHLYILRNQIIHGGLICNDHRKQDQLRSSVEILSFLMPVFIDIMIENPDKYWGEPFTEK